MSDITCKAIMSKEAIELDLDGKTISIQLDGDIDFTPLAKNLITLIEKKSSVDITWTDTDEPTGKAQVAKEVIGKIIASFNKVIEDQFDEEEENSNARN